MNKVYNTIKLEQTIEVPRAEIRRWQSLLNSEEPIDYDKENLKEISTVWRKIAKFSDGFELELKIFTNAKESGEIRAEVELFNKFGISISFEDCTDCIWGEHILSWIDENSRTLHEYVLNLTGI